jgi:hypothetical protein
MLITGLVPSSGGSAFPLIADNKVPVDVRGITVITHCVVAGFITLPEESSQERFPRRACAVFFLSLGQQFLIFQRLSFLYPSH